MPYTVVSWYTPQYEACNKRLVRSLKALDLPHAEYELPSTGSWFDNVLYKPLVLRAAFEELQTDIVYTDSDSVFHSRPVLFDEWYGDDLEPHAGAHLGAHYLKHRDRDELLGGTQYWRYCDLTRELIDAMEQRMKLAHQSSQVVLKDMVPQWEQERGLTVRRLPAAYCCIFDNKAQRDVCGGHPVVEHFQHSRQARFQRG